MPKVPPERGTDSGSARHVSEAGAIAFRKADPEPLFLLVTSQAAAEEWIFPKGHPKPGESLVDTALRELLEEAGVRGRAVAEVGVSVFGSGSENVEATYFLVEATGEGPTTEKRRKRWLTLADAMRRLTFDDARRLLRRAHRLLEDRHEDH